LEEVNGVDVLAVPVGGNGFTLDGKEAKAVVDQIEPKIVLLMHYKISGSKVKVDDEKSFCKEIGTCPREKTAKLILKKKDLEDAEMKVVMMEALSA
jgi:hypothetical protein